METAQFALPTLATLALGMALLAPLRKDQGNLRSTLGAHRKPPLKVDCSSIGLASESLPTNFTIPEPLPRDLVHSMIFAAGDAFRLVAGALRMLFGKLESQKRATPTIRPEASRGVAFQSAQDAGIAFGGHLEKLLSSSSAIEREAESAPAALEMSENGQGDDIKNRAIDRPQDRERMSLIQTEYVPTYVNSSTANSRADGPLAVRQKLLASERVVPLTRLPLRSHSSKVTWFATADTSPLMLTRGQRHARLSALAVGRGDTSVDQLRLACSEEDAEGRILAMRALMRVDAANGCAVFSEALRAGTDEERALAIDALGLVGARDALIPAFFDRVAAIAAKAALVYVGSNDRAHYRPALEQYLDGARIEELLQLLAGFLE